MFRFLSIFILLVVYSQIGYTQCNAITPTQSLVFVNQWTEYLQYDNANNSLLYEGQKTSNLLIDRQFYYSPSSTINAGGNTGSIPAKGYEVSKDCFLPLSIGDIKNIHTLKRSFSKGFYSVKLMLQGNTMNDVLFLYGNGAVSNMSISTALNYTTSSSVSGLNNSLYLVKNNSSDITERVIYLDGETNFLVYVKGKLQSFNSANNSSSTFSLYNSFQCSITPLSAPQQLCETYTPTIIKDNSSCGLGTISMKVLDKDAKYLFFYRENISGAYTVHADILEPSNNSEILIKNIRHTSNNIPQWGVIRMVDGCTFYETSNPIQFENQNFQINSSAITFLPPIQCGLNKGGIKIPLTPIVSGNTIKEGVYEIILQGQIAGITSYLRFTTEIVISKDVNNNDLSELILNDIPLNFTISKINILNIETNCTSEANLNYSFAPLSLPNISIAKELQPTICATRLTLQGIDNFPCGKIIWYENDKEIANSKSITVSPIATTTYTAKFFLGDNVFTTSQLVAHKIAPTIDNIQFSANPYTNNAGTFLNIKPITNLDFNNPTNCQCNYVIKDKVSNTTIITSNVCEFDIAGTNISGGTYLVTLTITSNNCEVTTSQLLEVVEPFNSPIYTTSSAVNLTELYPVTKSLLDEAYFIKKQASGSNHFITFQYNQQYEPFNSGQMTAKLYNWKRKVVAFSQRGREYGVQWYSMPIPPNVATASGSYILELIDDNGWFQKIRVKNIADNPICGRLKPESNDYCTISNNGFKLYDIENGQAPYQVKWVLSTTSDVVLEEKILTTQTDYSVYVPTITLNNNTSYKLVVYVTDACGKLFCTKNKLFEAKACSSPPNERIVSQEEIPKFEFRINVLPQTPKNPNAPIIKN
jgi:hypothetical protein